MAVAMGVGVGVDRAGEAVWEAIRPFAGGGESRRPKGVSNAIHPS